MLRALDRVAARSSHECTCWRRFDTRAQVALLALLAAYFMVWPLWRAGFPIEIAQNEGWNAYHADAAMGAAPLYPPTDTLIINNYPPLSFYVVGALAQVFGDALYVGRALSLVSAVALAALIATVIRAARRRARRRRGRRAVVRRRDGARVQPLRRHERSAARRPCADDGRAGVVPGREARGKSAVPPILAMAAAGFYKHNIVGGAGDRRCCGSPCRIGGAPCCRPSSGPAPRRWASLICIAAYGDVFLANLLTPRPFGVMRAINGLGRLQWILPALVLWGIWIAAEPKPRAARFTMLFVAVAFAAYLVQWAGEAILDNAQFDLVIATAVGLGLAFDRAGATAFGGAMARPRRAPSSCWSWRRGSSRPCASSRRWCCSIPATGRSILPMPKRCGRRRRASRKSPGRSPATTRWCAGSPASRSPMTISAPRCWWRPAPRTASTSRA